MRLLRFAASICAASQLQFVPTVTFVPYIQLQQKLATTSSIPLAVADSTDYASIAAQAMTDLTTGKFEEAVNKFNLVLEARQKVLFSNNADLYLSRGIAYEKLERWDDAIQDYYSANDIYRRNSFFPRDDPVAISNIANAKTGKLLWQEALEGFTYASKLDSNYLAPSIGRALVLYQLERKDDSFAFFADLIDKYPDYPDGLAALAVMSYISGATEDARAYWEQALQLDSRYLDIEWVRSIRRWPPLLVHDLEAFRAALKEDK